MDFDADYDVDADGLTLEQELLYGSNEGSARKLPEKRLDTPVCDGLSRRLHAYATDAEQHRPPGDNRLLSQRTNLAHDWKITVQPYPEKNYSNILPALAQFAEVCKTLDRIPEPIDPKAYPILYSLGDSTETHLIQDLATTNQIFDRVLDAYTNWIADVVKPPEVKRVRENLKRTTDPNLIDRCTRSAEISQFWSRVVDAYRESTYQKILPRYKRNDHTGMEMWMCSDYIVVRTKPGQMAPYPDTFIMVYEQMQMIQDLTLARHNTDIALITRMHNGTEKLPGLVQRLVEWQESCVSSHGNNGFELVKAPEAVFKSWINTLAKGDVLARTSYERTMEKIQAKERSIAGNTNLCDRLEEIVRTCDTIEDSAELFGLIKLSGHPIVYAETSARSVRAEALFSDRTRPLAAIRVTRAVKHIILSSYIQKHQEWPKFRTLPPYGSILKRHLNNRTTSLPLGSYPLSDLDEMEFGGFLNFDYSEDFLKFLDDKAISSGASQVWKFWWPAERDEPRRLLLKALSEEKIDMRALVERMRHGRTTREEEIVELTQKERELKPAARCFCKLPFYVRCFFTLTEYNLGESLLAHYVPQQTMTMTEAETKTRLFNMAFRTQKRDNMILEIDFSRWNLRWRSSVVNMVARICEDIFDLPGVFSQAHKYFERSTVVLTDNHSLPEGALPGTSAHTWKESDLVWRGHLGGFEGIQQKLWTLCTIGMIYTCVWDRPCQFLMAGQGDNQVLVLNFKRSNRSLADEILVLLGQLEVRCAQLNQLVKPDECIDSTAVLTYSKEIYVLGVQYSYSLKFMSRTMAVHDSDIPSFSSEVSSVCSTAMAVANYLPAPLLGYWWQTWRLIRLAREHARFSPSRNVQRLLGGFMSNQHSLKFLLLLPGSLGGLPLMSWGRYVIRGEVDELSWDVASLLRMRSDLLTKDLRIVLSGRHTPKKPDVTSLLIDPKSIPLRRPKDQTRLIKEQLELALPRMTRNSWLYEIMTTQVQTSADVLIADLLSARPFYPEIMADIYKHSIAGLRDDIYGRFNITRTIAKAVGGLSFARQIAEASAEQLTWISLRYQEAAHSPLGTSLFRPSDTQSVSIRLRSKWGVENSTGLGTTLCPLACALSRDPVSLPCISANTRTPLNEMLSSCGPHSPNFGTSTKQKRSEHGYKIHTSSDTVRHLKMLITTASQVGAGTKMRKVIDNIVRSRSAWDLPTLEPIFPSVYGGAAAHRHDSIRKKHLGTLGSATIPSHLSMSSDNSGQLAGGEEDFPIVFQEFYLALTNTFQVLSYALQPSEERLTLALLVPDMQPLPDETVESASASDPHWKVSVSNKLAYADKLDIRTISTRPPKNMIPDRKNKGKESVQVASYLLSVVDVKLDSVLRPDGIIFQPMEVFDIAEVSGCTLNSLLLGYAIFTIIETSWIIVRLGLRDAVHREGSLPLLIANHLAGPLSRSLLNPASGHLHSLAAEGIALLPGEKSALKFSRDVAGRISSIASSLVRSNYLMTLTDPLIVYADTRASGLHVFRKLACHYILQPWSVSSSSLRVPNTIRRAALNAFFISSHVGDAFSTAESGIRTIHNILTHYTRSQNAKVAYKAALALSHWPNCVWDPRDAREARRDLRTGRGKEGRGATIVPRVSSKTKPIGTTPNLDWEGTEDEPMTISSRTHTERALTIFYNTLERPIGVTTTALSVWLSVLSNHRDDFDGLAVLIVGVGRGATSVSCELLGAKSVVGLDLHSSIPAITQREIGYLPPELLHWNCSKFSWSPGVYSCSQGDWLQIRTDHDYLSQFSTIVIDIESDSLRMDDLLPKSFDGTCYTRTFMTRSKIAWTSSLPESTHLYCTDACTDNDTLSIITRFSHTAPGKLYGCSEAVNVTNIPPFRNPYRARTNNLLLRARSLLAQFPIQLDDFDITNVKRCLEQIEPLNRAQTRSTQQTDLQFSVLVLQTWVTCSHANPAQARRICTALDARALRTVTSLMSGKWSVSDFDS